MDSEPVPVSPNMLGLITTATPGGLTRTLLPGSFKDKLRGRDHLNVNYGKGNGIWN